LYPAQSQLNRYEVSFSHPVESHAVVTVSPGTAETVDLLPGTWTITAKAFKTGEETAAALGSVTVAITAGGSFAENIILVPADGEGIFNYEVTVPGGLASAALVITQVSGDAPDGEAAAGETRALAAGMNTGTIELAAGYYLLNIRLTKGGEGSPEAGADTLSAGKTEVVHIYPGLTTGAAFTFTDDDVTNPPPPSPEPGSLSITIGENLAHEVTVTGYSGSIILSKTGANTALTLTAEGYSDVVWYVDGEATGVTGGSFTLDAASFDIRNHSVTFWGVRESGPGGPGIPYAKLIPFTVVLAGPTDTADPVIQIGATAGQEEITAAVAAAMEGKYPGMDPALGEVWQIRIAGRNLSAAGLAKLYAGIAAALPEGDISLDLSACPGTAVACAELSGTAAAQKVIRDRFVAITLSESVTTLTDGASAAKGAFARFTRLCRVNAPGLTTIGSYAFSGCEALTAITLGENPPVFGDLPFNGLENRTITLPVPAGKKEAYEAAYADQNWGGTNITVIIIEET
jgi:hypothetical protein